MRQARTLSSRVIGYSRNIRLGSFLRLDKKFPEFACEVTSATIAGFNLDAAIIVSSDILDGSIDAYGGFQELDFAQQVEGPSSLILFRDEETVKILIQVARIIETSLIWSWMRLIVFIKARLQE